MSPATRHEVPFQPGREALRAPGRGELLAPVLHTWLALAGLSLIAGFGWRLAGSAPHIPVLLDGIGLALWLSALGLAPAWDSLLRRRIRHGRHGLGWTIQRLRDVRLVWVTAIILSLAPLGLLLAYNPLTVITNINAYELATIPVWLAVWIVLSLLLAGTAMVAAGLLLLHLCRLAAGTRWGTALWLLLSAGVHHNLVAGESFQLVRTADGLQLLSESLLARLPAGAAIYPLSLGEYAHWMGTTMAKTTQNGVFLGEWLFRLVRDPLMLVVAALLILSVLPWPVVRTTSRLPLGWLAPLGATAAVALRASILGWEWTLDTGRTFPGDWLSHFALGIGTIWLIWLAGEFHRRGHAPQLTAADLATHIYAAAAWVILGLPYVEAGQATQLQLLAAGGVAALAMLAGVLVIHRMARLRREGSPAPAIIIPVIAAAVLLLPGPAGERFISPALQGYFWLAQRMLQAGGNPAPYIAAALLLAACLLLWPWPARSKAPAASVSRLSS